MADLVPAVSKETLLPIIWIKSQKVEDVDVLYDESIFKSFIKKHTDVNNPSSEFIKKFVNEMLVKAIWEEDGYDERCIKQAVELENTRQ